MLTGPLVHEGPIDEILFSGGIGEYIYGADTEDHGDLGLLWAKEIRRHVASFDAPVREGPEKIRATVIGASQYTVQVSSSTIYLSNPSVLPLRDYQVVVPHWEDTPLTSEAVARSVRKALERLEIQEGDLRHPIALFLHWPFESSYSAFHTLASGLVLALGSRPSRHPWVLVFDTDIGGVVGTLLKQELEVKPELVAIDEIELRDFDFIDIGKEIGGRRAVPVVVKSLVFG